MEITIGILSSLVVAFVVISYKLHQKNIELVQQNNCVVSEKLELQGKVSESESKILESESKMEKYRVKIKELSEDGFIPLE